MNGRIIQREIDSIKKNLASKKPGESLTSAFKFLGIDEASYFRIRSIALKKQTLIYRFLNTEFKYSDPSYASHSAELLKLTDLALRMIRDALNAHQNQHLDSPFSYGLIGLDARSLHQAQQTTVTAGLRQFEQSVFRVGKKDSGVEPGFKAILKEDLFLTIRRVHPTRAARLKLHSENNHDISRLSQQLHASMPERMVKLAYAEVDRGHHIVVDEEDVKRSGQVQKYFSKGGQLLGTIAVKVFQMHKSVDYADKNCEALLEVLANDIARLFMPVQNQTLYQGRYPNGLLQLMLMQEMNKNARILGPLAGDSRANENRNYCVKPILQPVRGVRFLSDDSIPHLAELLAIMLVQGDADGIGSAGQNKMRDGDSIYGIDFGHAYQDSIIGALTRFFQITNPKFKNYSIFHDAPRRDIVRGLLKVAAIGGYKLDDAVLMSYGSDFKKEIDKLRAHQGADEAIFDDYERRIQELKAELTASDDPADIKEANITCCQKLLASLDKTKKQHKRDRDYLIFLFRDYLSLEAPAIDLLENLERLCTQRDKISLRSPDGEVLLNHLRIEDPRRAEWKVRLKDNGEYELSGSFYSDDLAIHAINMLNEMAPSEHGIFTLNRSEKTVVMTFAKEHLPVLNSIFHEDNIKDKYCHDDYDLYLRFRAEAAVKDFVATFPQFGADATFTSENDVYTLTLTARPPHGIDPLFAYFFRKHLAETKVGFVDTGNTLQITLAPKMLATFQRRMAPLSAEIDEVKQQLDIFASINSQLAADDVLKNKLAFVLHTYHDHYELELVPLSIDISAKSAFNVCQSILNRYLSPSIKSPTSYRISVEQLSELNGVLSDLRIAFKSVYAPLPSLPGHAVMYAATTLRQTDGAVKSTLTFGK